MRGWRNSEKGTLLMDSCYCALQGKSSVRTCVRTCVCVLFCANRHSMRSFPFIHLREEDLNFTKGYILTSKAISLSRIMTDAQLQGNIVV